MASCKTQSVSLMGAMLFPSWQWCQRTFFLRIQYFAKVVIFFTIHTNADLRRYTRLCADAMFILEQYSITSDLQIMKSCVTIFTFFLILFIIFCLFWEIKLVWNICVQFFFSKSLFLVLFVSIFMAYLSFLIPVNISQSSHIYIYSKVHWAHTKLSLL